MHAACYVTFSRVWLFATPWTAVYQAPLSMGFSRQEYWSGCHWVPPRKHNKLNNLGEKEKCLERNKLPKPSQGKMDNQNRPITSEFSSVQSLTCVQLFATPWTAPCQASLSITNSQSLLKLMSIASVTPSYHLILCCPLLPPSIFPSIRVFFQWVGFSYQVQKYWSFSFSISPSNEYSGLISCRIDWILL